MSIGTTIFMYNFKKRAVYLKDTQRAYITVNTAQKVS